MRLHVKKPRNIIEALIWLGDIGIYLQSIIRGLTRNATFKSKFRQFPSRIITGKNSMPTITGTDGNDVISSGAGVLWCREAVEQSAALLP
jgi:hypothetical protein